MSRASSTQRFSPDNAAMSSAPPIAKQAGVGLMLGEEKGKEGVVVKQLVPRAAADRTQKVKLGDQLLKVGEQDVTQHTVADMRHLIIGEIGSYVDITFRSAASGQVYSVELQRGTPEYLDGLTDGAAPVRSAISSADHVTPLYKSNGSTAEFGHRGPSAPASAAAGGHASLQEENDWLRSALRLAESHVNRDKEELKSLHAIFERQKQETDNRVAMLQEQIAKRDAERREAEQRAWSADEGRRSAEVRLAEAARREEAHREEARKVYENEQMRLEYIQELKRRFEEEKRQLEAELVRMHDGLRAERQKRVEAEAVETSLRQEIARLGEVYRAVVAKSNAGAEKVKEQAEKIREIQRQNSSLTIMLSEIQPRLTVLEQDVFSSSKLDVELPASLASAPPPHTNAISARDDEVIMA